VDFVAQFPVPPQLRAPLQQVLSAALRGEASEWPDTLTETDARVLIEHGVAPLIYASTGVPELRSEAIRAAAYEPLRAADLATVLAALAARGVAVLVLKGTALAYGLYATPEMRPRSDTDLFIAHESLDTLREVMLALGFAEHPSSGDEHGLRQAVFTRELIVYDVHWSATNVPAFDAVLRFDDLQTRAIALPALGAEARGLSHVDALLLACIHRVAHHHDSDRLIWLVDIALLRERMSREKHELFWRMAAAGRVVGVCARSIAVAEEWLSLEPRAHAEEWLSDEELAREEPSRVFLDRGITHGGVMAASLRALPWPARMQRLRQLAFPPAEFMRHSFGTRHPLLLPWLYAYRGLRGVARLFRKARE
jgi:hypothetical protein